MEAIAENLGASLVSHYPPSILCKDSNDVAKTCAGIICGILEKNPAALICLPAGESAKETYGELIRLIRIGKANFEKARFVQLDEWLDLEDESENCSAFMARHFYGPAGIRAEQVTLFDIRGSDLTAACRRMDNYIHDAGPIDLMLLGLGMNGHLGLNEPSVNWDNRAVVVDLDPATKQVGQKYFSGTVNLSRGITLGMRYVFEAKQVVLQVIGEKKSHILKKIYESAPSMQLPGTVMQLLGEGRGVVVLDESAALLLNKEKLVSDKSWTLPRLVDTVK
jgi:6-phosphogluconolactonase/glucosamine-6-phosphate isomerase/deaminase